MHATTIQGVEDGVGEAMSEHGLDVALSEQIHRATHGEVGIAFRTYPNGLAFIDERDGVHLHGAGDGGSLAVIEGLGGPAADEARKVGQAGVAELRLPDQTLIDQRGKSGCIPRPVRRPAWSSRQTFSTTTQRLGSDCRIAPAQPVATRLMTTLVSTTTGALFSSRQLR